MNFVGQSADSPLLGNGFSARAGSPGLPRATSDLPGQSGATGRYVMSDGVSARGFAPGFGASSQAVGGGDAAFTLPGLSGGTSTPSGSQGGFLGLVNNLINQITSILNGYNGEVNAEGAGTQTVGDGTFASAGDPHLSENATVLGASGSTSPVNRHFDSMSSHDNLLSSQDFDGGYRLSSAVTAPNAKGVTLNASATVHANSDQDNITMRNDGSFSITSNGNNVALTTGQSVSLGGGETVTSNSDGSLTVLDQNMYGGSISTTLSARAGGVDATATVHNATVGGDIASGTATAAPAAAAVTPTINGFA